jgi:hypothetical protein
MQCSRCSQELTDPTHCTNCNWDNVTTTPITSIAGDSPQYSDDTSLPRNHPPLPSAADLPNQPAETESQTEKPEQGTLAATTDVNVSVRDNEINAEEVTIAGIVYKSGRETQTKIRHTSHHELPVRPGADETTPLLPPSVRNDVEVKARKTTVSKEASVACIIIEGPNPVAPSESLSNEKNQMHLDTDDFVADTLNFATLIWKQGK